MFLNHNLHALPFPPGVLGSKFKLVIPLLGRQKQDIAASSGAAWSTCQDPGQLG